MSAKIDPAMMKLIQKEIVEQIQKTNNIRSAVDENFKKKFEQIEIEIKKNQDILNKRAFDVMTEKGFAAGKQHANVAQPKATDRIAELNEKKNNFAAELEGLQEKFRKEIETEKAILKQFAKDATKSELGVSDMKVLTNKVATLEKIVKALMVASKSAGGAKPGGGGGDVEALKQQLAAQEKKIQDFTKMQSDMVAKSLKEIEVTKKYVEDGIEKVAVVGSKTVKGAVDDPIKFKVLEDSLKRMTEEKKMMDDAIKVVQAKQAKRAKEIEEAVAAAQAKMVAEAKEREKLRQEQMKKMKKDQDAMIKKTLEDMQKNVLESRIAALEQKLAQALGKG